MDTNAIPNIANSEAFESFLLYRIADFFKNLADGTRIYILFALAANEMCVHEIATMLNMSQSAISHQLRILRQAKLVRRDKNGKKVLYSLSDHHVKTILEMSLEHLKENR